MRTFSAIMHKIDAHCVEKLENGEKIDKYYPVVGILTNDMARPQVVVITEGGLALAEDLDHFQKFDFSRC